MLLSYSTGSYVDGNFYNKTETDTLLADKVSNIGNIDLPGMLDIGTSGYTNSRIRCNAVLDGYTGYAELRAANSYDMFLNLSTTRTDGGWVYFKINNDSYMQLSGSDNKVNIYKDTTISGNLDVGPSQAQTSIKAYVNHAGSTGHIEMEARWREQGFIHFKTNYTAGVLFFAVKDSLRDKIYMYCGNDIVYIYENTTIGKNLDVGSTGDNSIKIHGTGATTSYAEFKVSNGQNCIWDFINPSNSNVWSSIKVKGSTFMVFTPTDNLIIHYKPFANYSDDRLKENEELIENACETLSKLRPQLYDKKPDMENDDPTTWYKESGLIAQEIYYDAPELRHLVHKGKPEIDEEGNEIPLPEIPTSIDPQQDPDYSSWGKESASVNYIGLIAYLVKANTELHERVKVLEMNS